MPRPRQIDRGVVLDTALQVAGEAGLDAVTMRVVAGHLGVTPMALYRHVQDKADLLDGMVEHLLTQLPSPPPDLGWERQLRAIGDGLRSTAQRHPEAIALLLQRPARTTVSLARREQIYDVLKAAGVEVGSRERVERLISTMAIGFVLSEAAGRFRHHSALTIDEDFDALHRVIGDLVRGAARPVRSAGTANP